MSDLLAAAAAALGAPEHLVERAAQARADADGTSYEAVLAAWGGGGPAPSAQPSAPAEPDPSPPPSAPAAAPPPAPVPAAIPAAAAPVLVAEPPPAAPARRTRSQATPILEGRRLNPLRTAAALAGLFLLGLVIALIGPLNTRGDYRHRAPDPPRSALGEAGLSVYLNQGCGYCHTQLVRPVLADVGLGPATETYADALEGGVYGVQRIGPDLAHVGGRAPYGGDGDQAGMDGLAQLLRNPREVFPDGMHPSYSHLSDADLAALATYLAEST